MAYECKLRTNWGPSLRKSRGPYKVDPRTLGDSQAQTPHNFHHHRSLTHQRSQPRAFQAKHGLVSLLIIEHVVPPPYLSKFK